MWTFTAGAGAVRPGGRRDGAADRPAAVVGRRSTSPRRSSPSSPAARRSSPARSRARVIFGTIDQIVSFGSTPVIGEIAMLALAIILLRLMPQGITGRFFRIRHDPDPLSASGGSAGAGSSSRRSSCCCCSAVIDDQHADAAADLGAVRAVARPDVGLRRHPQLRPRRLLRARRLYLRHRVDERRREHRAAAAGDHRCRRGRRRASAR